MFDRVLKLPLNSYIAINKSLVLIVTIFIENFRCNFWDYYFQIKAKKDSSNFYYILR